MDKQIEMSIVEQAISNCNNASYPILVTGQDYADDLARALGVIKTLIIEVDKLQSVVNQLIKE